MTSQYPSRSEDNLKPASNISLDHYNHDIQFYGPDIPGNINLEDLKKLGDMRLTILRIVWEIISTSKRKRRNKSLQDLVLRLRSRGLKSFANLFEGSGCDVHDKERLCARWRDHVSHNAARLALSQNDEGQFWLQIAEEKLIEWRLTALNENGITAFMGTHNIQYPMVDQDEKEKLKISLTNLMDEPEKFDQTIFYKVPYLEALGALENRRVHLVSGVAYLTTSLMQSAIVYHFHHHLKMQIKKSLNAVYRQSDDPRVCDLINYLQKIHESMEPINWAAETADVEDLDGLAAKAYPPCMRKMHEALRKNHHLRNQGRVQYTLFLKAIGLPVEGAIELYREEFTQKMDDDNFDKEYPYYIRHLYGLEGGKRSYDSFDCAKISQLSASSDEYHGCPFAQEDIEDLGSMLTRWNISSIARVQIYNLTQEKQIGRACSIYFEDTQGCRVSTPIENPMDFYSQSRKLNGPRMRRGRREGDEAVAFYSNLWRREAVEIVDFDDEYERFSEPDEDNIDDEGNIDKTIKMI